MKIENNKVSFQSKIKFIDSKTFQNKIRHLNPKRHEVGWPWTADTMKTGKNLFTTGIMDCIAIGIIDGSKVSMLHLATYRYGEALRRNMKGFRIENVKRRILEHINLDNENLHAVILGGFELKPKDKHNSKHLNKIRKFFEDNKIPYSIFGARKDVHYFGKYSMYYSNKEDTFYITNNLSDNKALNGKGIEIDIKDNSIEYNTYKKERDKYGVNYKCIRKITGTEDFFKSQFRQVSVCKFDKLI